MPDQALVAYLGKRVEYNAVLVRELHAAAEQHCAGNVEPQDIANVWIESRIQPVTQHSRQPCSPMIANPVAEAIQDQHLRSRDKEVAVDCDVLSDD
ncbi:hypothetical protein [Paramicrobacterium humi]|uniref:hypothetical protein n=1 Tax=Paramicrobacterium humi TaxID=640635 RepID=UPI001FDEEBAF|nr:hypothetical protein [Microbacterium humi]